MYILKNAWRNVVRSKGRNILIGIIILVIAISSCVALSIREAAKQARESSMSQLEVTGQITVNRQEMMAAQDDREGMREALENMEGLSLEALESYAESEYVKSFYYSASVSMDAGEGIEAVNSGGTSGETKEASGEEENGGVVPGFGGMDSQMAGIQGDFTVTGYSSDEAMTSFISGNSVVTEGAMFPEGDTDSQCIISSELATYNDLEVGDTITLTNPSSEDESYTFTISGIYESTGTTDSAESMMGKFSPGFDSANQIYTSYEDLKAVAETSEAAQETITDETTGVETTTALRMQETGTYTFADVEDYEQFKAETEEQLGDSYTVTSSDVSAYEQSLVPLENLNTYASYFLAVVLTIGGIILAVLNIFNIRERKYEIGVLSAIGMKKGKIAVQFLAELLCVTFLAIFIGTGIGAALSVPVANRLLEQQIESQAQETEAQIQNFGREMGSDFAGNIQGEPPSDQPQGMQGPGITVNNYVSQVSQATNLTVVAWLAVIGVLLTAVSEGVAVIVILRYDPLRILSSRD